MLNQARDFAIAAHGDQTYGEQPYVFHLDAVVAHLTDFGEPAQVVGYLHDVVEDTPTTSDDIEQVFGEFVSQCVAIVTDEPGKNRKERKTKTYAKMKPRSRDPWRRQTLCKPFDQVTILRLRKTARKCSPEAENHGFDKPYVNIFDQFKIRCLRDNGRASLMVIH